MIMPNSNFVIQLSRTRDLSRNKVTTIDYTQLSMTDLADPPLLLDQRPPSELKQPRSVAVAGRPFTTEASRWSGALLQAEQVIYEALEEPMDLPAALDKPGPHNDSALTLSSRERASRRLVAAWVCGVLLGELDRESSLMDAEYWFAGTTTATTGLPASALSRTQAVLTEMVDREGALEMLPYALDPIPHEYRRNVVNGNGSGVARAARKRRGSFYTPSDVTEHIVCAALSQTHLRHPPRVLDPALGTGVFLRTTFKELLERGYSANEAISSLHGIDIDECAVDMAAFVLLVDFALASQSPVGETAFDSWWQIRSQLLAANSLVVLDGLGLENRLFQDESRPPEWLRERFDVIVGNPPYARLGEDADLESLASRFLSFESASPSTDVYLGFVELLCSQLRPEGAGALIVPMSVGYSTTSPVRRLREAALQAKGRWTFEFFDRTPDALFGDDVKQRTAIVTRYACQDRQLVTSPIMRWASSNRQGLFDRIPHVELGSHPFLDLVPKVGTCTQAAAYRQLKPSSDSLGSHAVGWQRVSASEADGGEASLYVAGTAYNWLNVYRTPISICSGIEQPTTSPLSEVTLASPEEADATYALLSSRLVFWLWRVEGDAFHVPSSWLRNVPTMGTLKDPLALTQLAAIGRSLWGEVVKHPIVSRNGGKTTQSYCPHAHSELLDSIDRTLLGAVGLPTALVDELKDFVHEMTIAGRSNDRDRGLQRALAAWRKD